MTDHPDLIGVSEDVRLRRFDPGSADEGLLQSLLPIYRDAETVRLLDGPQAEPYDLARLVAMYTAMSERGELYLVEALSSTGGWLPIGDAGLQQQALPMVLAPDYRGRGIGRAILQALIERARRLGWRQVRVSDIYHDNEAAKRRYTSVGFVIAGPTELGHRYVLHLT